MMMLEILPKVQKVAYNEGTFFSQSLVVEKEETEACYQVLHKALEGKLERGHCATINCDEVDGLPEEGYGLEIRSDGITLSYTTPKGLFYGGITLKHIITQYGKALPCMEMSDAPDLPVRGVSYDISRNKVPKLETLYQLVDLLANLKYNHLQLYVEGLSFEYPSFEKYLQEGCYLTREEIVQLQSYCKERFIDLVPNQNALGHMTEWLEIPALQALAAKPEGEVAFGMWQKPSTIDPKKEASKAFIQTLTKDMLEVYESPYYNPNLDETFGIEDGSTYVEWVKEMYDMTKAHNRQMIMWGDMLLTYTEEVASLPKDIILMNWGYEDHYPFHLECRKLQKSGHVFYVCPGTSTWLTLTGRTDNMIGNVDKSITCAHLYGATGLIMTEWGDGGHWQQFAISYPAFAYAAARAWNKGEVTEEALIVYCDQFMYKDSSKQLAKMTLEAGRCYHYDDFRVLNGSMLYHHYKIGLCQKEQLEKYVEKIQQWMIPYVNRFLEDGGEELLGQITHHKPYQYEEGKKHIKRLKQMLEDVQLMGEDKDMILSEYRLTLNMAQVSMDLRGYIDTQETMAEEEKIKYLEALNKQLEEVMVDFRHNWLMRNKGGNLEKSLEPMVQLHKELQGELGQ